ncbi:MAG TPA: ABC transporter ATP-binding protein [Opitutaceae bacterium]|nr:ABC transporter ATP-binding protein [Opitutaceae bacterium]
MLLVVMFFAGVAELVSLGTLGPFLAILANPNLLMENAHAVPYARLLHVGSVRDARLSLTVIFICAAVLSGAVRILMSSLTARLMRDIGHHLNMEFFSRTLLTDYVGHIERNSSEAIGALSKIDQVVFCLYNILILVGSLMIGTFIFCALMLVSPLVAAGVMFICGAIYGGVTTVARKKLARNSEIVAAGLSKRVQVLQESLGGIRDIILDGSHSFFIGRFREVDSEMRRAQASTNIIGPAPRLVIETTALTLVAVLAYNLLTTPESLAAGIPTIGTLVLGGQRLIPLFQQGYQSWVVGASGAHVLSDLLKVLEGKVESPNPVAAKPLPFEVAIELRGIGFHYKVGSPWVLRNATVTIKSGERIGIIGTTGSGKSTLTDILMGLLPPVEGAMLIDGRPLRPRDVPAWQQCVAHVPQSIYLADASIAENIAFGTKVEEIDLSRVRSAAERAQIMQFVDGLPQGLSTTVGERGVKLSGGQRQRIGIARALYKEAKLLIFDEATSALDRDTEQSVIEAINRLDKTLTVVIVTHRPAALSGCDKVFRIEGGLVTQDLASLKSSLTATAGIDRGFTADNEKT